MKLIDFTHTPKQAFINGFFKGMTPVVLFDDLEMPSLQPVDEIKSPYNANLSKWLAQDWVKIGKDFKQVLGNYESSKN